ncbi:DUF4434 domain-containing protein [Gracilimonas tropica]|uniref:DUF4434 domain-containing protein n=1 Tax=Gracilimonas tropica TaxID=454600 RepID=UPI00037E976B|nr:DUF4434 domain-containing protein [Gracilimonas tropica]
MIKLKGTFLDEITHDIPSQNWTREDWVKDFDAMKAVGIDTVILIRAGYKQHTVFNSDVLSKNMNTYPVYHDLLDLFLEQAERCDMDFFFGLYDSGKYWVNKEYQKEIELNKEYCDEVIQKYGDRKAFKGWYISHEIGRYEKGVLDVYEEMSVHLKKLKDQPILISPYVHGVKQFAVDAISFEQHTKEWREIFEHIAGHIDIVAFQDGQVGFDELKDYLEVHKALADEFGLECWSNVESFDRDMPIKFPPLPFKNLRYKMELAEKAGVENLITFEFSHFMSPNSMYLSAHGLYKQYCDWLKDQGFDIPSV